MTDEIEKSALQKALGISNRAALDAENTAGMLDYVTALMDKMIYPFAKSLDETIPRRQPPALPTANSEIEPTEHETFTPGKMPKVTHGKIAIDAAWQIERETGKRATAEQVINMMQSFVDSDDHPELLEKIPHGVRYATKSGKDNTYDIGACKKTLERWHKSRQQRH